VKTACGLQRSRVDPEDPSRSGDNYVERTALSAGISRARARQPNGNANTSQGGREAPRAVSETSCSDIHGFDAGEILLFLCRNFYLLALYRAAGGTVEKRIAKYNTSGSYRRN